MKLNNFLFLILIKIAKSSFELKSFQNHDVIDATHILIDHAVKRHASINVISAVKDEKSGNLLDHKGEILLKCKTGYAMIYHNHTGIRTGPKRKKRNTIFLLDTIEIFRQFQGEIVSTKFDFNGCFIFVLIDGFFNELEEIFAIMWLKNIYNVNVVYATMNETFIVTFLPFENPKSCGSTQPKVINIFRNRKLQDVRIFPQKFQNFNNCPVRVATFEDEDVVMQTGTDEYRGYCIDLLMALAKQLNFKPDINFLTQKLASGIVNENGTSTGALGEILKNQSDVALGDYFLKPSLISKFDHTATYQVMSLVWVIPPGRPYTPLEKLLQPFDLTVWMCTAIVIAIGVIVIMVINTKFPHLKAIVYGDNVNTPLINMIIGILGSSQTQLPMNNFARILIMIFLLFTLVLRTVYQGFLFEFLQSDGKHKEVQSVEEMIARDFTFYAFEASTLDLIKGSSMEVFNRTKKYENENFLLHTQLNGNEKLAGLETIKNVVNANQANITIYNCDEPFMKVNIVLFLRKDSYITRIFNENIVKLIAAGLMQHWIEMHHIEKFLKSSQKRKEKVQKRLSLHQLSGAFYLLFFGGLFASLVFICEVMRGGLLKFKKAFLQILIDK